MTVVGDSLLQRTEVPIYQPVLMSGDIYCMLGAWIQDTVERLLRFVQPSDYCPLTLFYRVTNVTQRWVCCHSEGPGQAGELS